MTGRVKEYVAAIARELKSGVATEHSYRPCLKALLEALLPGIDAINEPAGVACGAPDMMLRTRGAVKRPVGYVETKDIGDGDLDGNARKKETAPDGSKDENVFDIMQGVSINIFVKRGNVANGANVANAKSNDQLKTGNIGNGNTSTLATFSPSCRVFHAEVFGTREAKYAFLDAHDLATTDYRELHPAAPYFFFVPKDFPLYLYGENMGKVEKTPKLNPEIVKRIASAVGDGTPNMPTCSTRSTRLDNPPTAEDIFHYIYAVLHAPQYRARYKEFLKVDFPRIPYPANGEVFRRLAAIGERLVAVHLLKDPKVRDMFAPYANFPVSGDNRIEFLRWEKSEDLRDSAIPQPPKGRIYVNSEQYIDNVPAAAWEFFVGGYQPAQKWLKDRKGRVLTSDDLLHYKSIISALVETRRLMDELAGVPLAAKLGTLV